MLGEVARGEQQEQLRTVRTRVPSGENTALRSRRVDCGLAVPPSAEAAHRRAKSPLRPVAVRHRHSLDNRLLVRLHRGSRLLLPEQLRPFSSGSMDHLLLAGHDVTNHFLILCLDVRGHSAPSESLVLLVAEDEQSQSLSSHWRQQQQQQRSITIILGKATKVFIETSNFFLLFLVKANLLVKK